MEQLPIVISTIWDIIKNWWWVLTPLILYRPFLFFWLYWRREVWMLAQKSVLLEIKMPEEVLKPLRAMEQVFSAIWGNVFDPADWWEKWFEGKMLFSLQLEMVSLEGVPRLYIRCPEARRNAIEASIYSQYPDAEITVADDYTKYVPQDLPNKDWDIWGTDYQLNKDDVYPIKTYPKFFEERPEIAKEEKRIDPLSTLLEGMGIMGPGEQLWIQIVAQPITSSKKDAEGGYNFVAHGREVANELAKRPEEAKSKSIFWEVAETIITGKPPGAEEKKEEMVYPPEMRLTPGERDIVQGVENKIALKCFKSHIRFIYLAKRDNYFGGAKAVPFGFFSQFATENLNAPRPWTKTITKIHRYPILDLMRDRRIFMRKRRLFLRYINRMPPLFPKATPGKAHFILNIEELATMFHFPGRMAAPAPFMPRVEAKKGEAPPGLPTE